MPNSESLLVFLKIWGIVIYIRYLNMLHLFLKFLKFGLHAWGGPVAQIQMMKEECVDKEKWITLERFKRTLAVYQTLPGPEATELAVYFGMIKGGRIAAVLAGIGFILPGFLLMLLIAYLYHKIGVVALMPWFIGLKPAVAALICRSSYKLSRSLIHNKTLLNLCVITAIMTVLKINCFIILIFGGVFYSLHQIRKTEKLSYILLGVSLILSLVWYFYARNEVLMVNHSNANPNLLIEGLKAGLLTFGGAYTSIPFLESSLVNSGVLQKSVFLDAIAFANLIPSPLIMFGTFIGYHLNGIVGALLMTFGIFLPSFMFTLVGHNFLEKIIDYKPIHNFLDGLTASVVSLLWITAFNISFQVLHDIRLIPIFAICLGLFFYLKNKSAVPLVLVGCGVVGRCIYWG